MDSSAVSPVIPNDKPRSRIIKIIVVVLILFNLGVFGYFGYIKYVNLNNNLDKSPSVNISQKDGNMTPASSPITKTAQNPLNTTKSNFGSVIHTENTLGKHYQGVDVLEFFNQNNQRAGFMVRNITEKYVTFELALLLPEINLPQFYEIRTVEQSTGTVYTLGKLSRTDLGKIYNYYFRLDISEDADFSFDNLANQVNVTKTSSGSAEINSEIVASGIFTK